MVNPCPRLRNSLVTLFTSPNSPFYRYCHNDPVNYYDPTGLCELSDFLDQQYQENYNRVRPAPGYQPARLWYGEQQGGWNHGYVLIYNPYTDQMETYGFDGPGGSSIGYWTDGRITSPDRNLVSDWRQELFRQTIPDGMNEEDFLRAIIDNIRRDQEDTPVYSPFAPVIGNHCRTWARGTIRPDDPAFSDVRGMNSLQYSRPWSRFNWSNFSWETYQTPSWQRWNRYPIVIPGSQLP